MQERSSRRSVHIVDGVLMAVYDVWLTLVDI